MKNRPHRYYLLGCVIENKKLKEAIFTQVFIKPMYRFKDPLKN